MKIEYCILSVECLIPIMSWYFITINNIETKFNYGSDIKRLYFTLKNMHKLL